MSFFLAACATFSDKKLNLQRIEQLDEAANFLMMVSDQVSELDTTCQINPSEALVLIRGLHAMMDKEIKEGSFAITREIENSCENECHCGIYADLAQEQKLKDRLYQKAQSFSKSKIVGCAIKTSKWFCKSKLLETLHLNQEPSMQNSASGL